jgi:hypothetical protein
MEDPPERFQAAAIWNGMDNERSNESGVSTM